MSCCGVRPVVGSRRASLSTFAMFCMLFDHVVVVFGPSPWTWWGVLSRVPGRFSMPAFALLVASGVLTGRGGAVPFLRRLWSWALLSEVPYIAVFGHPVNAVFALAVGASVAVLFRGGRSLFGLLLLVAFGALCLRLGQGFELAYSCLVLAFVALLSGGGFLALLFAFGFASFLNGGGLYVVSTWLCLAWVLWGSLPRLPSAPRPLRYGFYPLHLSLLFGLSHVIAI